mgnify:CR=1 FL=1
MRNPWEFIVSSINFDQNIHSDVGDGVFETDWFS